MTPTARTLKQLRTDGWEAAVVEKWIPHIRRRVDLYGCIDILAMREGSPVLAVQATSAANVASRINKAKGEPRLRIWLRCGQRFEVWGWAKHGKAGRQKRWTCRKVAVALADLMENPATIAPGTTINVKDEP